MTFDEWVATLPSGPRENIQSAMKRGEPCFSFECWKTAQLAALKSIRPSMINLIVAIDEDEAIGWLDGRLPWKAALDMKRFKELTTGHAVVMGYNTFKSLNRPNGLPNRENFVLTHRPYDEARSLVGEKVSILNNLLDVQALSDTRCGSDIWIIGGASVYTEALELKLVDRIYLTQIHSTSGADVKLSGLFDWEAFIARQAELGVYWQLHELHRPIVEHPHPTVTFIVLQRTYESVQKQGL